MFKHVQACLDSPGSTIACVTTAAVYCY